MIPRGKGFFIWQIPRCGSIQLVADTAALCGLGHVLIKIANGTAGYGVVNGVDLAAELARALQQNGVEAWGWQYIYGNLPKQEAARAVQRVEETGVTGFVIDAEGDAKGKAGAMQIYTENLRAEIKGLPIGLSSYRFPSLHPELPWNILRAICDFDQPQVYWMLAHNAGDQLRRCVREFESFERKLPLVPTGAAFREYGWQPMASEVVDFMRTAGELGLTSINWWEWYDALYVLNNGVWETITGYEEPKPAPESNKVMVDVDTLTIRNAPVVTSSTVVGYTYKGKVWEVSGRVSDGMGRTWIKSGETAHMAAWLCKEI
jgi:hypothetical protein